MGKKDYTLYPPILISIDEFTKTYHDPNNSELNTRICCYLQIALLGRITPNIRAIGFSYIKEELLLLIALYDSEPTEEDEHEIDCALSEMMANIYFIGGDFRCLKYLGDVNEIKEITRFVYMRKE
jgi:hypothetical protein